MTAVGLEPTPAAQVNDAEEQGEGEGEGEYEGEDEGEDEEALAQDRFHLAACYVTDAMLGRLDSGKAFVSFHGPAAQWAFAVQTSAAFEAVLLVASVTQMQLAWWEPPNSFEVAPGESWPAVPIEALIVALFWFDNWLKAFYMGCRRYLRKPWHRAYLLLALLYTLDLLLLAADVGRPLRLFRGLTLLLRARSLRKLSMAILAAGKVIGVSAAMLVLLMLAYAAVGARAFGHAYSYAALSAEDRESAGAYDDTLVAFATTFQLLTTETYPHIAYPAYEALGPWSQVYFISFWWGATAAPPDPPSAHAPPARRPPARPTDRTTVARWRRRARV